MDLLQLQFVHALSSEVRDGVLSVDAQTVRGVFLDFSDWLRANHPIASPRIMCIDEAKRVPRCCAQC